MPANSGREALKALLTTDFALVLMDVAMPDLSPVEMHRRLRELGDGVERRLVFTCAGALSPEVASYVSEAGILCLDKPFDPSEIHALLRPLV